MTEGPATWVAAIGTAAATLLIAITFAVNAWQRYREGATSVHAWPVTQLEVAVRNDGRRPIYSVGVGLEPTMKDLPAGMSDVVWLDEYLPVVGPGEEVRSKIDNPDCWHPARRPVVTFYDSRNRYWRMDSKGRVRRGWRGRRPGDGPAI